MERSMEERLLSAAQVSSVSDIPAYPFVSHEELRSAINAGQAKLGIEPGPARELAHLTNPNTGERALLIFSWVPFLLVAVSIVAAVATKTWPLLLGGITAFLGMGLASPYTLRIGRIIALLGTFLVAYNLLSGIPVLSISSWLSISFVLAYLAVRALNQLAWSWMHDAILDSEAPTAYLFKTGGLHIKDTEGHMHSCELQ